MNIKTLFKILLLFFSAMGFGSCRSDDDEKKEICPLSFEKEYYEVPLLGNQSISIRGGNRNYSVTVEKTEILDVSVDLSSSIGMGNLVITPKQKGETTVTIKDNIVNEEVGLKIKVTDSYLAYAIKNSNHPALSQGTLVYLINNEAKDCYFFRNTGSGTGVTNTLIAKGTYEFSVKIEYGIGNSSNTYGIPYLTLNYGSDINGNFTDAAIAHTPHSLRFELLDGETSSNTVINMIQVCLGVDWKALVHETLSRSVGIEEPILKTTIDDTNYTIVGVLNTTPAIPENILE